MRTSWIEVSQQSTVPLLKWLASLLGIIALGINMIYDDQFDCALGSSVWVGRTNWAVLGDRYHVGNSSRIAIDSRRGGEDDVWDIVLGHAPEENDSPANIDTIILERNLGRFSHCLEHKSVSLPPKIMKNYLQSSKVDNTVNIGMRSKDFVQCFLIRNIDLVEVWSLATEELDAIERDFRRIVQAVDDHDFVAMLKERKRGKRTNIAGASVSLHISIL